MDVKRQISVTTIEIDPKAEKSRDSRSQLCRKMSATAANEVIATAANEVISPLKRKSSSPVEITSLHSHCDSKRRRHHRRKSNKKWRQQNLSTETGVSLGLKAPGPVSTTTDKSTKNVKMCAKLGSSPNQLSWKRKRKTNFNNFFANQNQNTFKAIPKAPSSGQHSQVGVGNQRLPGACGGPSKKRANVVLRPTKVPLLNAPRNSTQFIIDDHESSDLVKNREC